MEEASMTAQSLWLQMIIYGAFSASTTPAVRPPMTSTYGGTMLPDCARSKNLFGFGLRDQIRHHAHRYNLGKGRQALALAAGIEHLPLSGLDLGLEFCDTSQYTPAPPAYSAYS
jgi:hypothetical protein